MTLDIEITCTCGSELKASYGGDEIIVEPCRDCLDDAKKEADAAGHDRGLKVSKEDEYQ